MKLEVDKFYTWGSTLTVAGMASMLWVVLGTVSSAFSWRYPGWFPLLLAFVFVIVGDFAQRTAAQAEPAASQLFARVPLWAVNACLVYTTTLGGAHAVQEPPQKQVEERVEQAVEQAQSAAPAASPTVTPPVPSPAPDAPKPQPDLHAVPRPKPRIAITPRITTSAARPEATATAVDATTLKQALRVPARTGFNRIVDTALVAAPAGDSRL